jgi:hypothetical protein
MPKMTKLFGILSIRSYDLSANCQTGLEFGTLVFEIFYICWIVFRQLA